MASATVAQTQEQVGANEVQKLVITSPLLAVACVGKKGARKDKQAKHADYVSALLGFHRDFGFDAMYQVLDEEDEKENDDAALKYRTEHVTKFEKKNIDENKIQNAKYRTEWNFNNEADNTNDNELFSFVQEVSKKLDDKKNEYDGLVFVLTGCAELGQNHEDIDQGFKRIADSSGKRFMELIDIFKQFDKDHCRRDDWETFPMIFMIDRYCVMTREELKIYDKNTGIADVLVFTSPYRPPCVDDQIHLRQFYGSDRPYAIVTEKEGGLVTRGIQAACKIKPKFEAATSVKTLFIRCNDYIRRSRTTALALYRQPEKYWKTRFAWSCWE